MGLRPSSSALWQENKWKITTACLTLCLLIQILSQKIFICPNPKSKTSSVKETEIVLQLECCHSSLKNKQTKKHSSIALAITKVTTNSKCHNHDCSVLHNWSEMKKVQTRCVYSYIIALLHTGEKGGKPGPFNASCNQLMICYRSCALAWFPFPHGLITSKREADHSIAVSVCVYGEIAAGGGGGRWVDGGGVMGWGLWGHGLTTRTHPSMCLAVKHKACPPRREIVI